MKSYQLIGLVGILILVICGFLPLAYLDGTALTILPVSDNFNVANSLWVWKDISAFSVTYGLTLILSVYLILKKYKPGYLIAASLNLVVLLFMYFTVWLTSVKSEDFSEFTFEYSYLILLIILGYVLYFYGGLKITKE